MVIKTPRPQFVGHTLADSRVNECSNSGHRWPSTVGIRCNFFLGSLLLWNKKKHSQLREGGLDAKLNDFRRGRRSIGIN